MAQAEINEAINAALNAPRGAAGGLAVMRALLAFSKPTTAKGGVSI